MKLRRVHPVYFDFRGNNHNLRPLPHRANNNLLAANRNNNINNNDNNNLNQQVNRQMANADISRLAPSKFTGAPEENARVWLTKFETYANRMQFDDDAKLEVFILFLSDASESWFLYLADNNKDTWAHLRAAFLRRFGEAGVNNVIYSDLFYTRTQKENEKVSDFITSMLSLGAKLQIPADQVTRTIARALLPPIRAHCLAHNVQDLDELTRQATLAEIYLVKPVEKHTQFSDLTPSKRYEQIKTDQQIAELHDITSEIKNMVTEMSRLQISSVERPRSLTPNRSQNQINTNNTYNGNNRNWGQQAQQRGRTEQRKQCYYCGLSNHLIANCRKRINDMRANRPNNRNNFNSFRPRDSSYNRQNFE